MHLMDIWILVSFLVTCLSVNVSAEGTLPPDADPWDEPSAPRKLSARVISPTSVKVKWRDSDVQKQGQGQHGIQDRMYIVGYGSPPANIPFQTFVTKHRRLTLVNLEPGIIYDVTVRVVTQVLGPWSKVLKVTIDDQESSHEVFIKKLKAKEVTPTSVLLTWQYHNPFNQMIVSTTVTVDPATRLQQAVTATLTGKTGSHVVRGLKPSTQYAFSVQAATKFGITEAAQITAETKANVLTKKPRSLRLRVLNSTILSVRWQSPSLRPRNGPLIGYKIQYKRQGGKKGGIVTVTTSKNTRVYRIEDLERGQTYKVRVSAFNKAGDGPYTKWKPVVIGNRNRKHKKGDKSKGDGSRKKDRDGKGKVDPRDEESREMVGEGGIDVDGMRGVNFTEDAWLGVHEQNASKEEMLNATEDILMDTGENPLEPSTLLANLTLSTAVPLLPPGRVRILKITATTIHLGWDAPDCCPEMSYGVEIRNLNDFSVKRTLNRDTNVLLTGLEPDTRYRGQITAIDEGSESPPSESVDFQTTKAVTPEVKDASATKAVLGRTANLSCLAHGEELATITWLLEDGKQFVNFTDAPWINIAGRTVVRSSTFGYNVSSSSLLLYNVTEDAERDFACLASNSAGSDQGIISLTVEVPPAIVSRRGMHVMVGTAAQLECAVKGKPLPDISWIHNATGLVYRERDQRNRAVSDYVSSVTEGTNIRRSFLVIERTSLEQGGVYTCVAVSGLGRTDADVSLDVLVPPPPPVRKIQALPLSPSRVSVTWLPPLDYPYSIRYYQVSVHDAQRAQLGIIQTTRVGADLSNLLPNSTYFIGVTAATEHGLGDTGPEVKVVTLSNLGLEPADVSVEAINSTSIQVNWNRPSTIRPLYIRGYNIYLKPWKDRQVKNYHVRGGEGEQFVIELGAATQYELRMSTLTTWGFEAFTAWSKVRKPRRKSPPRPARDFSATSIKSKSLVLKWREPKANSEPNVHPGSNQVLAYSIGYSTADSQDIRLEEITGNKRQLQLNGLEPDTNYRIFIQALGSFGTSDSVYLSVKTKSLPPTMVLNPTARAVSSSKIHLRWSAPKRGPVTRYHIRYWRPGHKDKQSAWMSGNYRDYIAGSLRKNSNYRFEVIPYNGDVLGEGIVIFSSTLADKPDGPPKQVKLLAVNATTFEASWSPPDPQTTNGKIIGYRLVLKAKNGRRVANFEVEANRRNFTFLSMKVSDGYKLRMAAVNGNGTGVFSQPVQISYNQETEIPAPPTNVKIIPSVLSLTMVWDEPEFTGSPTLGYIVGYGQFIPDVFRTVLENSQMTHTIKNLKPNSEYIVSVRSFNSIGESKPTFLLTRTKPIPLKPIPLESPLQLTVLAVSLTSLLVSWKDPALVKYPTLDDKRFYQIRYSSIDGETYSYLNTSSSDLLLSGLEKSTVYETSVRVIRGNETSDWSHPAVNSTQQLVPGGPPTAITTSPVPGKPKLLHLNWSEPSQPNGVIQSYSIYLSADPSLDPSKWIILETHLRKVTIRKLMPYIPYYLKLRARNKAGYGPLSDLMVYVPPIDKNAQPAILSVSSVDGNGSVAITVTWKAPREVKGPITGYMVYFVKSTDNIYTDWMMQFENGLHGTLSGLDFNTTYFIKVRAGYPDSSGPFSERVNYTTPEGSLSEGLESDDISYGGILPNVSTSIKLQKDVKQESDASPKHIPTKDPTSLTILVKGEASADSGLAPLPPNDTFRTRVPNDDHSVHIGSRSNVQINASNNDNNNYNTSSNSPMPNMSPLSDPTTRGEVDGRNHKGKDSEFNNNGGRRQIFVENGNSKKVKGSKKRGNKNSDDDDGDEDENDWRNNFTKKMDRKRKRKLRKRKEKRRREKMRKFGKKSKAKLKPEVETTTSMTFPPSSVGWTGKNSSPAEYVKSDRTPTSIRFESSSSNVNNEKVIGPRYVQSSAGSDGSSAANEDLQISTQK